jgi:hypothetical protein
MEILATNIEPVVTRFIAYPESWISDFKTANQVTIATGYVSVESLSHVTELVKLKDDLHLQLIVGMALRDGLTSGQLKGMRTLDTLLRSQNKGEVSVVSNFAFHGKVSLFIDTNGEKISYVGSSNLSGVLPINKSDSRTYEIDVKITDFESVGKVEKVLSDLITKSTIPLTEAEKNIRIIRGNNDAVFGMKTTKFVTSDEYASLSLNHKIGDLMTIEISTSPGSSLNDFFGSRKNSKTGKKTQRDWYEVGLIVSKSDRTASADFPVLTEFFVVTDDGFQFVGKTSGSDGKNFSSRGNNRIFGRWIKGKLEDAGVLNVGERVTDQTLLEYGNSKLVLQKTEILKFDEEKKKQLPVYLLSYPRSIGDFLESNGAA